MESKNQTLSIILFAVITFITFFVNNQIIMPDIMESRNIVTAREMVYDGNWIVTTMNGSLRLEKPPLPTWLTALAEIVSPDNICLQRGMAGLAAVLLTLYLFFFARRVLRIDPWLPTLLLVTSYNVILIGRTASWDIYCHAFMMGCIYHCAVALLQKGAQWKNLLVAGLYMGLSMMSKGPVSHYALFLPFLMSLCFFKRPLQLKGKGMAIVTAIIIALVVGAWWYVYIYLLKADDMVAVANKESGSWINRNVRPWYYYWAFFLETGIWAVLLLTAIFLPLFRKEQRRSKSFVFSMGWMLFSLILLSLLPEKKNRYLLPMLIPACCVMACLLEWWKDKAQLRKSDRVMMRINCIIIAVAIAILPVAAWLFLVRENHIGWLSFSVITITCLFFVGILIKATRQLNVRLLLHSVTVLFLLAECFALPLVEGIINNPEKQSIAQTREMKELDGLKFYYNQEDEMRMEVVYAANRKILPIDITDSETIISHLPMVLLTHQPIDVALPQDVLNKLETKSVGLFDDNNRPKDNRRYSDVFVYHATILKSKTIENE